MPKWLESTVTQSGTSGHQQDRQAESKTTRTSDVVAKSETSVQTQAPVNGASETKSTQEGEDVKTVDAGVVITFSVPIRGGLFNDGNANPPI